MAGTINVTSNPSDATIVLDNVVTYELTPHIFTVAVGNHEVYVTLGGYELPDTETVNVKEGKESKVNFTLKPILPGSIRITTKPEGAFVRLDDNPTDFETVGEGNVGEYTFENVAAGPHWVGMRMPYYNRESFNITVESGKQAKIEVKLTLKPPKYYCPTCKKEYELTPRKIKTHVKDASGNVIIKEKDNVKNKSKTKGVVAF